ncbi:hypothetical protein ACOME3_008465 [Neoechinorhynchus agilis]
MIEYLLIMNKTGKPRLASFYISLTEQEQQSVILRTFQAICKRSDKSCCFVEHVIPDRPSSKLVYRYYATVYICIHIDESENELAILDLIQAFVEVLDLCFHNVCELDLIFNPDKINYIVQEMITGGMVVETNVREIVHRIKEIDMTEKSAKTSAKTAKELSSPTKILNKLGDVPTGFRFQ